MDGGSGLPALRLENVSKTFPGQRALDGVGIELRRGKVRALLGENGSGKSTLIKILAGYHQPDPGWSASADGAPLELGSATAASRAGVRFIHQDLGLVADLDVIDNLALGGHYAGRRWIGRRREVAAAESLLAQYGIEMSVSAPLRKLAPAEQTIVAIVRALRDGLDGRILVLDEPTGSLSGPEVADLFRVVQTVRDRGGAVLYVTHRLHEIFEIADDVTVLRDGRQVADRPVEGLDEGQLAELLVGRPLSSVFPPLPNPSDDLAFSATSIAGERIRSVSLSARKGEIVGVAGIIGSGREELPYLLFGARPWRAGRIRIGVRTFDAITVRKSIAAGVAFAPADRQRDSAIQALSVRENATLPSIPCRRWTGWVSKRREASEVRNWLVQLDVRPPDPERRLGSLSGGNQQRVVLARWLRCDPAVLLLEEPTRGVDIGAKAEIYRIIADAAGQGAGVIIFSSDAEELASVCDRVVVLRDGSVATELSGPALSEGAIVEQSIYERSVT